MDICTRVSPLSHPYLYMLRISTIPAQHTSNTYLLHGHYKPNTFSGCIPHPYTRCTLSRNSAPCPRIIRIRFVSIPSRYRLCSPFRGPSHRRRNMRLNPAPGISNSCLCKQKQSWTGPAKPKNRAVTASSQPPFGWPFAKPI